MKENSEPLSPLLVQSTQISHLNYCKNLLRSLFFTQQSSDLLKRLVISHHFCAQTSCGSIWAALPFILLLHLQPLFSGSHLAGHNGLLAVSLGFTSPDSHTAPSLPSGLCLIMVLPRKLSNSLYFNKIAPSSPPLPLSIFFSLLYFLYSTYVFIVPFSH